jgi:hypothetical protein
VEKVELCGLKGFRMNVKTGICRKGEELCHIL